MNPPRDTAAFVAAGIALGFSAFCERSALAEDAPPHTEQTSVPAPSQHAYVQYGVALAAEAVAFAGDICGRYVNCVFGDGGGLVARVGWRPSDQLYLGGAYEMTKQDPAQLYRLGILQQLRAEGRRYFPTGQKVMPFVLLGAGLGAYGNEWSVDTWGPTATIGGGAEIELGGGPVLELSLAYRPMYFRAWNITGTPFDMGFAHFVSIEVSLEAKDRL